MAKLPPQTTTSTSHSITIKTGDDVTIGYINTWSPTASRQITPIYELNSESQGDPLENVPGNVNSLTISVNRYDIFKLQMEDAFGTPDMTMLSAQDRPFMVQEVWLTPDGGGWGWQYEGCWFGNIGRQLSSTGDRIVNVSATLHYVRKCRISL